LNQLYDHVVLEPPDLQKLFNLRSDLELQVKQMELLMSEIQTLVQPAPNQCFASLVIIKQPFPFVISKNKQIHPEDMLQVQLITGATLQIQSFSPVRASLVVDGPSTTQKQLEGDVQNLDPRTRIAKFPLKFVQGTKKAPVNVRFAMQIQIATHSSAVTVESNSSSPLVVITNECQWEGSAGTLLKKESFPSGQIPWPRFANTLQHHFLKATRQELSEPRRILSPYDMNYLHTKFFDAKDMIGQKDFDMFWEWFGKSMQKLRYQRHLGNMWQNGLLYGFMGREDVDAALLNQDPGTFIMRFSERHAGQLAIAYTGTERPTRIKHYLVQPNDTAAARRTLPDFLLECPQFAILLVLTYDGIGKPAFLKSPKDQVLEPYCGRKPNQTSDIGYDPL